MVRRMSIGVVNARSNSRSRIGLDGNGSPQSLQQRGKRKRHNEEKESDHPITEPTHRANSKRARQTDHLSAMPHDLIFEICARLFPIDLLNMTFLNKIFRGALLSRDYRVLWIRKRRSLGLPEPPPGFGEVRWMNLLLGPWICWRCRVNAAQKVIFAQATRLCSGCIRETTVSKDRLFRTEDNEFGIDKKGKAKRIMGLVHPVPADVLIGGRVPYPSQDVRLVLGELAACRNGQARLRYVQTRRKTIIEEMMYYAKCEKQLAECEALLESCRYEDAKRRLFDIGYNEADFLVVKAIFRGTKPLTEHEWRIKETFVHGLIQHVRLRDAHRNKNPVVHSRYTKFAKVCRKIKFSLRPIETRDFPTPSTILEEISFDKSLARLIVAPDYVSVTQADFEGLREEIVQTMYQVRHECQRRLSYVYDEDPVVSADKVRFLSFGLIPLASSESLYSVGKRGSFHIVRKLSEMGFEPLLTAPDQMDARRDLLRCTSRGCSQSFEGSWREWLSHVSSEHEDELEYEESLDLAGISFELVHGRQDTKSFGWSCNYCHAVSTAVISTVMEHLNHDHGVATPQVPDDLFVEDPAAHLDRF
ncbi:hypothetical protein PM082_012363 [Marasmius tenuissimus]|nr:hypothetical protein PM082_012363 [Marasmius tenuissimus]